MLNKTPEYKKDYLYTISLISLIY